MAEANLTRCDLAIEAHEMLAMGKTADFSVSGVTVEEKRHNDYIKITRIKVDDENGERELGKPRGSYITIEMPSRFYGQQEIYEEMCRTCAAELKKLVQRFLPDKNSSVLVIGLGNRNITADALGPKVIKSLMITRHLIEYIPEEIDERIRPVCAATPGVLGLTGIETGEIIKGLTDRIKPDLVIAIDALCSHKVERINTTVQFCDTGITPGEGIGNKRRTIDEEGLGVPVIAIGVPTVVNAATIAREAIESVADKLKESSGIEIPDSDKAEKTVYDITSEMFGNLIVAPKEVDSVIDDISHVIANGINIALHEGITMEDIDRYV